MTLPRDSNFPEAPLDAPAIPGRTECHLFHGGGWVTLCGEGTWGIPSDHRHALAAVCPECHLARCRRCRALAIEGVGAVGAYSPSDSPSPTSGPAPRSATQPGPDTAPNPRPSREPLP